MRGLIGICLMVLMLATSAVAVEQLDLTVPDQAKPGTTTYTIKELNLNWEQKVVVIVLLGANNEEKQVVYRNSAALIIALNKTDLSVKSLQRRIMERLIADGHIGGTISGSPD